MRSTVYYNVKCNRTDCFANENSTRECTALKDTDFKEKKCPFYKSRNKEKDR